MSNKYNYYTALPLHHTVPLIYVNVITSSILT